MLNLTIEQVMNIIHNQGGIVAETNTDPELIFHKLYLPLLGKKVMLGDFEAKVINVQYYPKSEPQYGLITYKFEDYELKLVKKVKK